jgi:hypothetical protein
LDIEGLCRLRHRPVPYRSWLWDGGTCSQQTEIPKTPKIKYFPRMGAPFKDKFMLPPLRRGLLVMASDLMGKINHVLENGSMSMQRSGDCCHQANMADVSVPLALDCRTLRDQSRGQSIAVARLNQRVHVPRGQKGWWGIAPRIIHRLGRALIGHTDKGPLNDWPAEGQES